MKIGAIAGVIAVGLAILPLAGCQTAGIDKEPATDAGAQKSPGPATSEELEIESFGLTPAEVRQGGPVEARVQYTLPRVAGAGAGDIKVNETYTIVKGQDAIQLSQREVLRRAGSHNSTLKFTLPRDLPKGDYTLVTTLSDGKTTRTARASLRVI